MRAINRCKECTKDCELEDAVDDFECLERRRELDEIVNAKQFKKWMELEGDQDDVDVEDGLIKRNMLELEVDIDYEEVERRAEDSLKIDAEDTYDEDMDDNSIDVSMIRLPEDCLEFEDVSNFDIDVSDFDKKDGDEAEGEKSNLEQERLQQELLESEYDIARLQMDVSTLSQRSVSWNNVFPVSK